MTILVIGSQGTIGKPLVQELFERGHTVITVGLRHSYEPYHSRCDISKYRQIKSLLKRCKPDIVYNLAAEFGRKNGEDFYEQLWMTNVVGLKNILRIQEKQKFRLVHFSSSEIYGEVETCDGFYSEELSDLIALKQKNDYAISKWAGELQIRNSIATKNVETMILRLFNAYGPGEYYTPYRSVVAIFVFKALHDQTYDVYLGYRRVFMYIDDLIHTLCNIVDKFKSGKTYNIGGEKYVEVKEVSDIILKYLGKNDSLVNYQSEDVHNVVSKRPDISKAKRDLAHKLTVPLSIGIPKTIEWQKEIYNV